MKKNDPRFIDFFYGLILFLISLLLWFVVIPTQIKTRDAYFADAAMIPRFAVFVMGIMSLCQVILCLWETKDFKPLFNRSSYEIQWKTILRQLLFLVLMIGYIKLIPVCGFVIASFAFVLVMLFYFGSNAIRKNLIISAVFSVSTYLLFSNIFRVNLPQGWLPL